MVTFIYSRDTGLSMTVVMSSFLWKLIGITTKVSLFKEKRATIRRYLDMVNDVWQTRIHRMKSAMYTNTVRPLTSPLNLLKGCEAQGESLRVTPPAFAHAIPSARMPFPHNLHLNPEQSHSFFKTQVSVTVYCGQRLKGSWCTRRATAVLTRAPRCRRLTGGLPLS